MSNFGISLVAAGVLATQPCVAVAQGFHPNERRIGAFAGVKLSVPLGRQQREKPTARFQLTAAHEAREMGTGEVRTFRPSGFELGVSASGETKVMIGGRDAPQFENQLGISGTGTTILVVAGVVLVLLVVAAANTPPNVDFND